MTRVAVQAGRAWTRVAAEGRLVAELPSCGVGSALACLFDDPVDELIVVQPAGAPPPAGAGLRAHVVRAVPAAVAALAQHTLTQHPAAQHTLTQHTFARHGAGTAVPATRPGPSGVAVGHPAPPGAVVDAVVVDVGHGGAEIAAVRAGRIVAVRRLPVGGVRLDVDTAAALAGAAATVTPAEARRVREARSLLPEGRAGTPPVVGHADGLRAALAAPLTAVVDAGTALVAAAGTGRAPLVLLIGGVARTPLHAELLDAAGVGHVAVADRPDAAAVTGALLLPDGPVAGPHGTASVGAPAGGWLPPVRPVRRRRSRVALGALVAVAGTAGLLAAGAALPPAAPAAAGDLVQYGYAVRLPAGWAHTGGLPERRRSLITPVAAPDGTDLISVERTPLGYDADTEPGRARAELRAEFAAAVEGGAPLSGFDDGARYAGRPVVAYRESGGGTAGDVDWYVVLEGDAQLSVGCRHTQAGTGPVAAACVTVVGSVHRTS
ncbi:MAG: hypothetical protein QOK35_3209 [Pseudonocardiales bacterium]|nr:hypothetical protein [Pseudonocardiales bacterium]